MPPYHQHDHLISALSWTVCLFCHRNLFPTCGCNSLGACHLHKTVSIRSLCVNIFVLCPQILCFFFFCLFVSKCVCMFAFKVVCLSVCENQQLAPGVLDHGRFCNGCPPCLITHLIWIPRECVCVCVSQQGTHTPRGKQKKETHSSYTPTQTHTCCAVCFCRTSSTCAGWCTGSPHAVLLRRWLTG